MVNVTSLVTKLFCSYEEGHITKVEERFLSVNAVNHTLENVNETFNPKCFVW